MIDPTLIALGLLLIIALLANKAINRYFAIREKQINQTDSAIQSAVTDAIKAAKTDIKNYVNAEASKLRSESAELQTQFELLCQANGRFQDRLDKLNIEKLKQQVAKISVQNGFRVDE